MPTYDRLKAQQAIRAAKACERLPGSELLTGLAEQLALAGADLLAAEDKINNANRNAKIYQDQFELERAAYKKLREEGAGFEKCVELLRAIAVSGKGAQAKANELLKALKLEAPNDGAPPPAETK